MLITEIPLSTKISSPEHVLGTAKVLGLSTITAGVAAVNFNFSANRLHEIKTTTATKPQMIAAQGSTTEHPVVIAANPPSKPLQTLVTF
jgi:hypothetical protein